MQTQAAARLGNEFLSTPSARRATGRIATICNNVAKFLSTPSARRATSPLPVVGQGRRISIHALREEGDSCCVTPSTTTSVFLSTPSARRATLLSEHFRLDAVQFLSTPSARRATAPLFLQPKGSRHFYPRPPRGGRLRRDRHGRHGIMISIHALREEGD